MHSEPFNFVPAKPPSTIDCRCTTPSEVRARVSTPKLQEAAGRELKFSSEFAVRRRDRRRLNVCLIPGLPDKDVNVLHKVVRTLRLPHSNVNNPALSHQAAVVDRRAIWFLCPGFVSVRQAIRSSVVGGQGHTKNDQEKYANGKNDQQPLQRNLLQKTALDKHLVQVKNTLELFLDTCLYIQIGRLKACC
ncbi:MAG: hypothetical protein JWP63_3833 [Candidatus Solibacter sp.]|nr:hypothetical protein [Candidatus Solibacter sp.]